MEWRPVRGYEGRYEVSDSGGVRSLLTNRILKPGLTSRGYLSVALYDGSSPKRPRSRTVHSLVSEAFIRARTDGLTVNHRDGDKTNNALANLEVVTMSDNLKHAFKTGLKQPPKQRSLTARQVRLIWRVTHSKPKRGTYAALARRFGVAPSIIHDVTRGRSYVGWMNNFENSRQKKIAGE